jgi:hypothetical protein
MNPLDPRTPPVIDMTPDGRFREPVRQRPDVGAANRVPASFKLLIGAVVVAVLAGTAAVAALALWVVSMLLPAMVIAGGVAYAAFKYRQWRGGTSPRRFVRRW